MGAEEIQRDYGAIVISRTLNTWDC